MGIKVLFLLNKRDRPYINQIRTYAPGWMTGGKVLFDEQISYISEIDSLCESNNCQAVITTDYRVLKILFPDKKFKDPDTKGQGLSVLDFQGNTLKTKAGRKILIAAPLRHLYAKKESPFLFRRFLEKLGPNSSKHFLSLPPVDPIFCDTKDKLEEALQYLSKSDLFATDIETGSKQRITHISFATIERTYVITVRDLIDVSYIRKILMTDAMKIAQNGKYDFLHLLHWGCPAKNWYWDTYGLMQCWYAELPRTLAFLGSFLLDDLLYWKDEIETDKALYNAKDSHVTLWAFLSWMKFAPDWAKENYRMKFPTVFPHLSCEFEGLAVDKAKWAESVIRERNILKEELASINKCLGKKTFNPNSPDQVKSLLNLLAPKLKPKSSDKATLAKVSFRHPLNAHIISKIARYREALKLHSTYLDAMLWNGRVIYSLDAFGTETGRSACKASSFNEVINNKYRHYGIQVQNIPSSYKVCIKSDPDYLLCEIDRSQAESRCTAYLSRSDNMIDAVENSPDFHCQNASLFFGIPFDQLYDTENKKVLNKPIRTLSKRTNHGANYNMGEAVLIRTMGEENLWRAKSLLKLNESWGLKDIASYLLEAFDKGYPRLRDTVDGWYGELIYEWKMEGNKIKTPDGWTRYFFGDPQESKPALNELVAHSPQHLNVALVDEGYFNIWYNFELGQPEKVRIKGQIHDSILFQIHKDHLDLLPDIQKMWDDSGKITIHGKEMVIPSEMDGPKEFWK